MRLRYGALFHRWLDNHEIVKLFFMVALVAAPSILLCVVGLLIAMNLDADVSHRNNGWRLFGALHATSRFSWVLPLVGQDAQPSLAFSCSDYGVR